MKPNFCFVNVSFTLRYVQTQHRLRASIVKYHPNAELFFWTDEYPPGSKTHNGSYYGFKVHAIQYARERGYTKVIWIDTCAVLNAPIEPLIKLCEGNDGFFAIQDDNKLYRYSGQWFKAKYNPSVKWHLLGGSIYIFDFQKNKASLIFEDWRYMEDNGEFGSSDPKYTEKNDGIDNCGHRMDETCLAYCMYMRGVKPFDPATGKYNQDEETSIILKKHFLELGAKWYDQV